MTDEKIRDSPCSGKEKDQGYGSATSSPRAELLEEGSLSYYNVDMLTGFPFSDEWQSPGRVKGLFSAARWNQYVSNWSIALDALRQLWEIGKVSELKSPFYEPVQKPTVPKR